MKLNLSAGLTILFLAATGLAQAQEQAQDETPSSLPRPNIFGETPVPPSPTASPSPISPTLGSPADLMTTDTISSAARLAVLLPTDDEEIRGLEVLSNMNGFQTQDQLLELSGSVVAGGFNRVYPELRTAYGVAFISTTEASLPFISPAFPNPAVELKSKLAGTAKVFPIVNLLPAYSAVTGIKPLPGNIVAKFPAFRNQSINGDFVAGDNQIYLDPGSTAVQDYLVAIMLEIDTKTLSDGYLLAGVSYPGKEWGYSDRAVEEFRAVVGGSGPPLADDPTWAAYRRDQLTQLLKRLKSAVTKDRPGVKFSVLVQPEGPPPATWEEWIKSPTYENKMQDWVEWCRDGVVDEIVLEVHERLSPQGNTLEGWTNFLTSNCAPARPVVSLSGGMNFNEALTSQYQLVRSRGVGTLLHHYASPSRSGSRGFFASLPNVIFNVPPGKGLPPKPLMGTAEFRQFSRMLHPPETYTKPATATSAATNPLNDSTFVFATPSPIPTATAVPKFVPEASSRRVTLTSGIVVDAVITEVTPTTITLEAAGGAALEIARSRIASIEPPL